MTPDVSFVSPDTPVAEIARRMRDESIGALPVTENDRMAVLRARAARSAT
jgi:CBS domain-containing protein